MSEPTKQKTRNLAAFYRDVLGLRVLPAAKQGKKPAVGYKRLLESGKAFPMSRLREFINKGHGLCCVVTEGVFCRDFDSAEAYRIWAERHPDLAASLHTVKTPRGHHTWFAASMDDFRVFSPHSGVWSLDDGELRAAGSIVMLPPTSGYEWKYRPLQPLLTLDFEESELHKQFCDKRDPLDNKDELLSKRLKGSKGSKESKGSKAVPRGDEGKNGEKFGDDAISQAIAKTVPTGSRQRHRAIFTFARHLKAIPELCDKSADNLEDIFARWFSVAVKHIQTTDYEINWAEFSEAWDNVEHPAGESPVDDIFARVNELPIPEFAQHKRYDRRPVERRLIAICAALQDRVGDKPFYLGSHFTAPLVGSTQQNVSRILRNLVSAETLELVKRGSGRQAHYYRFHGGT